MDMNTTNATSFGEAINLGEVFDSLQAKIVWLKHNTEHYLREAQPAIAGCLNEMSDLIASVHIKPVSESTITSKVFADGSVLTGVGPTPGEPLQSIAEDTPPE